MTDDEVVTYADAARWLPRDVRTAIEVTRPCVTGGRHDWEHRQIDISSFDGGRGTLNHWQCPGCGVHTDTDPERHQPAEQWPRAAR